jgi:hypothetical protein
MYLAFGLGAASPVLEVIRRWSQLTDPSCFVLWFDDFVIGAALLTTAWMVRRSLADGRPYLCAAWGYATGQMVGSLISQIRFIHDPEPAPVSSVAVAFIKAGILLVCILGLALSLRKPQVRTI